MGTTPDMQMGRIAGRIVSALDNDQGIAGASITLHAGVNSPTLRFTNSDSDGYYSIDNIPEDLYYLQITADGYIPETFEVRVEQGVTTHIHQLRAIPWNLPGVGTVSGSIINAFTGSLVTDTITLEFRKSFFLLGELVETITVTNGQYSLLLPSGNYNVTARGNGYISTQTFVISLAFRDLPNQDIVISPEFAPGDSAIRIVLTWGELPSDLDSHLVGPTPDGNRFHVYFDDMNHYYNSSLYANLDVDDVTSYGPETVTVYNLVDGQYDYYIHDYTNLYSTTSHYLRNSQAAVRIYSSNNELLRTYNVPVGGGASTIWHVFSLVVQNGQYTIVANGTMQNIPTDPNDVGRQQSNSLSPVA